MKPLQIWRGQQVIGFVAEASFKPGQFFWVTTTGGMSYAPTAQDAADAAKKRYRQDQKDLRKRLKRYELDTYNTRKKVKKR